MHQFLRRAVARMSLSASVFRSRAFRPIAPRSLNVYFPHRARCRFAGFLCRSFFHLAASKWPIYLFSIERRSARSGHFFLSMALDESTEETKHHGDRSKSAVPTGCKNYVKCSNYASMEDAKMYSGSLKVVDF